LSSIRKNNVIASLAEDKDIALDEATKRIPPNVDGSAYELDKNG
jgi:hypothetical protein